MPSRLLQQWPCDNECPWAYEVQWCILCAQVHELSQSHCGDNREKIWFSEFHTYAHLVSAKFEHCVS